MSQPSAESDWLDGEALTTPASGKLHGLLATIARELGSEHRKIIAAAFALRFGSAASAAIGPFCRANVIPNVALSNIALKFGPTALLERVTLRARGDSQFSCGLSGDVPPGSLEAWAQRVPALRAALCDQATPVLQALASWSKLRLPALWGLVLSA